MPISILALVIRRKIELLGLVVQDKTLRLRCTLLAFVSAAGSYTAVSLEMRPRAF